MAMQRKWQRSWQRGNSDFMKCRPAEKKNNVFKLTSRLAKYILPPVAGASILLATMTGAYANPTGGQVTTGAGTIAQSGKVMTITQTTDKLGINWQSFGIGAGEKVQFIQPGASSVALNRVIGTNASAIYGTLSANGKVFLVNPNGVLFAPGAQVNVGGLVVSTLNLTDSDFMAGKYKFTGNGGSVVNQGNITVSDGGYVALLGSQVKNEGIIVAQKGTVALGAGNAVTLDMNGDGLLNIVVNQGALQALAENKNLIQADGGQVILTARAANVLADTVVNNTGIIQARSVSNINGVIRLDGGTNGTVTNRGTLDASGKTVNQTGGTIQVLGDKVELTGQAKLDTSGANGGGTILVGGNYQGKGPEQNATNTYIGKDVNINADAISQGNGGKVVVWADNKTEFGGNISARGGGNSGDGGNVEVSGKQKLGYKGFTDLRATSGKTGHLLLDPTDYTVAASGGDITGAALGTQLGSANVTILSSDGTHGGTNGDINVNDAVNWSSNNTLTLSAYRDVNVNANITATGNTAGLTITPATGGSGSYNLGGAKITLSGTNPSLTIAGQSYAVINSVTALQNINTNLAGYYALGTDIDASETSGWNSGAGFVPVGYYPPFTGVFDGSGHTITGLTINRPATNNIGLFGNASGNIRNVGLINGNFIGQAYVGSLAGQTASASITNCYSTSSVTGNAAVGGLVGLANAGTIIGSYSTGVVTGTAGHYVLQHVGGLVGWNTGSIMNSYSTAAVTALNNNMATGGLVGSNTYGSISNSYSSGVVNSSYAVGGLVGYNYDGTITNSYSTGAVAGENYVGGLVGYYTSGSITNAYSTGAVTGTSNVGGLAGFSNYSFFPNSYWDTETSGQTSSAGGTGQTTAQMLQSSNYGGWDFTNTWYMVDSNTRPFLRSEYSTTITNGHQLQLMALNLGAKYTLANNIDMSELTQAAGLWNTATGFVPIGNSSTTFTGTFDGGGHTIDKLTIYRPETISVGLFGFTSYPAQISNVGLTNMDISAQAVVGGLAGYNGGRITNSYSTGRVGYIPKLGWSSGHYGGLAGYNGGGITNSYSTANVTGDQSVGGLVGSNWYANITNSYSTGTVSGNYFVGGLVGQANGGIVSSYWNTSTSGMATSGGGTGLTTEQMMDHNNFTGWDLTNTWRIYDGYTNPLLKVFMTPITVTASNASRTYDGSVSNGGNGVTYSKPSAMLLGTLSYTGTAQGARNAGDYSITPTGLYSTGQQGYDITYVDGTLTINKAELTVTANGQNKVYDGTASATVTYGDNRVAGDTLTISGTAAFGDKNVGNGKAVSVSGIALAGADAGNYSFNTTTLTTADITKRDLTVTANGQNKVYDGTTSASVAYGDNRVAGDTLTISGTAAFGDKNVGDGKAVSVSGIALGGTDAGNYAFNTTAGTTADITKRSLTISANGQNKVYDGTTSASVAYGDNRVAGDTLTISGTAAFGDKNVGNGKAVSVSGVALGGADAGNYSFNTSASTTADITARSLTITATGQNKVYDGTTNASVSYGDNRVAGDTLTISGTAAFGDKNVGDGKSVSVSGIALGGADAGNYSFNTTALATANITRRDLTITANNAARYFGASNPDFGVTYTGLAGADTSNSLSGALSLTTTATPLSSLGSYPIVPSGLFSANYNITYINGILRITRMPDTYTSALSFAAQTAVSVNNQAGNSNGGGMQGGANPLLNIIGVDSI